MEGDDSSWRIANALSRRRSEATAQGQDYEVQYRWNAPDGEPERWFLSQGPADCRRKMVALNRYFGVVIDITEQKLMEEALRESEMRMRLAQEGARAGAWEWNLTDNTLKLSDSLWSLYGLQKPEGWESSIEGWVAIIHPADRERVIAAVMEATSLGHNYEVQWRFIVPEGEPERWFLTRGSPLANAKGSPDRYFGVVIDITEQKLMEQALRESELRMRLAQEAAKAGAWEWKLADNSMQWSDSLWSLYGVEKKDRWKPSMERWAPMIHPADRESVIAAILDAAVLGHDYEVQWRLKAPEGQPDRWFLNRGRALAGADGRADRYFGVIIDITEQKLAEKALRESEMRMRLAQEAAKAGAWEWRLSDNNLQWSDSLWSLYGMRKPEHWRPTLEAWASLIHPADLERVASTVSAVTAVGQEYEVQYRSLPSEGEPERWFLSRGRAARGRKWKLGPLFRRRHRNNRTETHGGGPSRERRAADFPALPERCSSRHR